MWRFKVDGGRIATWIDGGIPPKDFLVEYCTRPYLLDCGIDPQVVRKYGLNRRSYRKSLSRIELTETVARTYIENYLEAADLDSNDYYLWITRPRSPPPRRGAFRYMQRIPPAPTVNLGALDNDDETPLDPVRTDILHVMPDLAGIRKDAYHQMISLHRYSEQTEREIRHRTSLGMFANENGFRVAPDNAHYRADLFSDEVIRLLRELLDDPAPNAAIHHCKLHVVRHRQP